jgi:Winged helix DNA-binding domain
VTNRAIAHARLRASRLVADGGLPALATPADVVRWFGAVQSQDLPGALWALAQRLPAGTSADDLEGVFDRGEIVRTHVMRPTWHFLAPEDLRWMEGLTGPRVQRQNASLQRRLGIPDEAFDRAIEVFTDVMRGGRSLTRAELRRCLSDAGVDVADPFATTLFGMHAELEGVICNGPRRGRQFTFMLADDRVPPVPPLSPDDALRTLTVRYFRSHGPALVHDMAWWSGLTVRDVRRGTELAGGDLERRTIDGKDYWAAAGGFEPGDVPDAHVLLLSNYDEYLGSYTDYSPVFAASLPKARNIGDVLGAHLVVRDGLVVGGWRRALARDRVTVTVTLVARLSRAEMGALEAEAAAVGRFFGGPAEMRISQG